MFCWLFLVISGQCRYENILSKIQLSFVLSENWRVHLIIDVSTGEFVGHRHRGPNLNVVRPSL